jgi:hypothetical protein
MFEEYHFPESCVIYPPFHRCSIAFSYLSLCWSCAESVASSCGCALVLWVEWAGACIVQRLHPHVEHA